MNRIIGGVTALALAGSVLASSGCTDTQKGAGIGAATGAALGGIIGHQSGKGGQGALIGAGLGALAGTAIGQHKDKRKVEAENERLRTEAAIARQQLELQQIEAENAALEAQLNP